MRPGSALRAWRRRCDRVNRRWLLAVRHTLAYDGPMRCRNGRIGIVLLVIAAACGSGTADSVETTIAPAVTTSPESGEELFDPTRATTTTAGTEAAETPMSEWCDENLVESTLDSLFSDMNRGSNSIVDTYVAGPGIFEWFATPDRPYPGAGSQRLGIDDHLAELYSRGDQFTLLDVDFTGLRTRAAHFGFEMEHQAASGEASIGFGKGSLDCDSRMLRAFIVTAW
jgi:hypothetical protein